MTMKVFAVGEVLTAADVNEYLVNVKYVRKAVDETITSSTSLQNDDELFLSVDANKTYEVFFVATYNGATAGDISWRVTGPASSTLTMPSIGIQQAGAGSGDDLTEAYNQALPVAQQYGALGTGILSPIYWHGLIVVAGTAGTIQFQWAQNTSSGTATTVKAGSFMILRRVA